MSNMEILRNSRIYEKSDFTVNSIADMSGKTAIVTGGNSGIGYEVCLALASKNATVYMASRSKQRADAAIEKIEKATGKKVLFLQLDLQDLNQVREAARDFVAKDVALDLLINNAGN
jgi:retinol dehydrogenase 12